MSEELTHIREKLKDHEERISEIERLLQTHPEHIGKKLSVREFILSRNPLTEAQKTLAIAYYLEKYDGLTSINAKDLLAGFQRAKEKSPRNINFEVIRNIQSGYMMEAREKKEKRKAWCLTNSGEELVDCNFNEEK